MSVDRRAHAVLVPQAQAIGMIGVIRSLGAAGYRVHAVSSDAEALGLQSALTTHSAVHPDYTNPAFLPWLDDYLAKHDISAIVPSEGFLLAIESAYDRYRALSISNVVEIYAALGRSAGGAGEWSDLVMSRLNNIEAQLEETINPVLIGGYKLEVRAVYEHRLASSSLINARLDANYAVLRDITNESMLMLEVRAVAPGAFLRHPGVGIDEKARAVFQNLIPRAELESYLDERPDGDPDGRLRAALQGA